MCSSRGRIAHHSRQECSTGGLPISRRQTCSIGAHLAGHGQTHRMHKHRGASQPLPLDFSASGASASGTCRPCRPAMNPALTCDEPHRRCLPAMSACNEPPCRRTWPKPAAVLPRHATTSGVLALKLKFDNRTQELGMPQMLQDLRSSVLQHPEGSTAFGTDRWLVANLGSPSLRSLAGRAPK